MNINTKVGCGTFLTLIGIIFAIVVSLCFWTDRTLDCWCTYFAHHAVNVPMWLSCLATIMGNGLMLILNIISEIARLIMGI